MRETQTMSTARTRTPAGAGRVLFAVLLLVAGAVSADTTTAADIRKEVAELGAAVGNYSADRRDALVERTRTTLEHVDARIQAMQAELDSQADELSADARARREQALASLRAQRTRVAEWYGAMQHGSSEAWEEIRDGFSGAWNAMRQSLSGETN